MHIINQIIKPDKWPLSLCDCRVWGQSPACRHSQAGNYDNYKQINLTMCICTGNLIIKLDMSPPSLCHCRVCGQCPACRLNQWAPEHLWPACESYPGHPGVKYTGIIQQ